MLLRVLVWLLLILAVWWLLRSKRPRSAAPPPARPAAPAAPAARALAQPEPMVDCASCGLHLPASEAVRDDEGRAYCCIEHRARAAGSS